MFAKILVPLDGSALAEHALEPALALARTLDGEVLLLRSLVPIYTAMPDLAGPYGWTWPDLDQEVSRREIETYLDDVKGRCQCPGCHVRVVVVEGDPASVIVDTAREEDVDLIAMSTHGESGFNRALFGSVTERVLHSAHCPVLITRSKRPIARVLVTLDGSRLAERALEPALQLATRLGARVHLLRVNEPVLLPADDMPPWQLEEVLLPSDLVAELHVAGEVYMQDLMLRYGLSPSQVKPLVLEGAAVESILGYAQANNIDLIAMSTHGRTGLRRWLYGSVTQKVMRRSDCAMLIIRPPAAELAG